MKTALIALVLGLFSVTAVYANEGAEPTAKAGHHKGHKKGKKADAPKTDAAAPATGDATAPAAGDATAPAPK